MIRLILNKTALDWFEAKRISFHPESLTRLKVGDALLFDENLCLEPYIGIYSGYSLSPMGFMSYTNSKLPPKVRVGRYCSFAGGIAFPKPRHPIEHVSTSVFTHLPSTDLVQRVKRDMSHGYDHFFPNPEKDDPVIKHDVWIGMSAAIMPGLTIGTGAVVAARSVVTRSVKPYEIVGGNPARVIKMRFPEEIVARLLASKWWEYRFTDLEKFDLGNPERFLDSFEKAKGSIEPFSPPPIRMTELAQLIRTEASAYTRK